MMSRLCRFGAPEESSRSPQLATRGVQAGWLLLAAVVATVAVVTSAIADDPPKPARPFRPGGFKPGAARQAAAKGAEKPAAPKTAAKVRPVSRAVSERVSSGPHDSATIAAEADRLIGEELNEANATPAGRAGDEDFLRRVTLDLSGTLPSVSEVTLFGLDPDATKRTKAIDRLLASDDFSRNWARYWRDVVFSRATDMRAQLGAQSFEDWLHGEFKKNAGWDQIVTSILTATGDVRENGNTALIFAHGAEAAEIAAEASRVFLGIQIQCANCHDHPTDAWKREQFHQFAAFFPRIRLQPKLNVTPRTFEVVSLDSTPGGRNGLEPMAMLRENPEMFIRRNDRNGDGKVSKNEVQNAPIAQFFDRLLSIGDTDKDGALSADELKKLPQPQMAGRGSREYYMPDLDNPSARGKKIDPVFFVGEQKPGSDLGDEERRTYLAKVMTSPSNPWFAKAFVNRVWSEMLGEGFYMPVDDMGPERKARFGEVLDVLADGFVANKYDVRWVYRTIAMTDAYQRKIQVRENSENPTPFVAATPTRLRSDQVYSSLTRVLDIDQLGGGGGQRRPMAGGPGGPRSPRQFFAQLFGFDPSTPQDEITGSVPQALFLMNSPVLNNQLRGEGSTTLGRILAKYSVDRDALNEVYLHVLSREPSESELKICEEYIAEVKNRKEAFEDLMWSLLNSSEFLTKR